MGQFDKDAVRVDSGASSRSSRTERRPSRPVVFSRREDEERTTLMPQKRPSSPPSVGPSTGPSRNGQPTGRTSARQPRPTLPPVLADEPTMIKPHAAPRSGWSKAPPSRSSRPPSPAPNTSLAPRVRASAPPPPQPRPSSPPSVIIPDEGPSLPAVSHDIEPSLQGTLQTMEIIPPRRTRWTGKPVFAVAGGLVLLGALFAFGLIVGIGSLVRTSAASPRLAAATTAPVVPVALSPVVIAAALPVAAAVAAPAIPVAALPPAAAPPDSPAGPAATPIAPTAIQPAPRPAPVAMHSYAAPAVHTAPVRPAAAQVARVAVHAAAPQTVAVAAPAPKAAPADDTALPPTPKAHKGKASDSDLNDAKAAAELARAQLEASLR